MFLLKYATTTTIANIAATNIDHSRKGADRPTAANSRTAAVLKSLDCLLS